MSIGFLLLIGILVAVVVLGVGGYLNSTSTSNSATNSHPLGFKPGYVINWPGTPTESIQSFPMGDGESTHYHASFSNKRPEGLVMYSVIVMEHEQDAMQGHTPEELLNAYLLGSKSKETSRKSVSHGPMKYPGLEVTTKDERLTGRRQVIMAGRRLYAVQVSCSRDETLLSLPEVVAFFESFRIID